MTDYAKAIAIVTGGGSGIGRALSKELASRGTHVVLADLDLEDAETVAAEIHEAGGKATARQLDVSHFAPFAEVIQSTVNEHGRLDFMFNNAGIAMAGGMEEQTVESWDRIIDVNFKGVVHGAQAAYSIMKEQGFGHIINTASMAGLIPGPMGTGYFSTKAAVVGLSKSLRAEAAQFGVKVSTLCPGAIRTPILGGGKHGLMTPGVDADRERDLMLQAFERMGPMDPEDFAREALKRIERNQATIILPTRWRLVWWLERLAPGLMLKLSEWQAREGRKRLEQIRLKREA